MNRFIHSILSLAVAVGLSACNKNSTQPRKPAAGPATEEKKKPVHSHDDDDDAPSKKKNAEPRDEAVDPAPAVKNKIPPPPTPTNPEYAQKADGKPGYVASPYDPQHRLIDVRGLPPGTEAECPYTRRTFLVPP